MANKQPPAAGLQSLLGYVPPVLALLIRPHPRIADEEGKQRARLLSTLLLVTIAAGLFIMNSALIIDPGDINSPMISADIIATVIVGVLYGVNRLGYSRWGQAPVL